MTSTEIKESLKKLVTPYEVLQQIDQLFLEVATLRVENARLVGEVEALRDHENETHRRLGIILGNDYSLENLAIKLTASVHDLSNQLQLHKQALEKAREWFYNIDVAVDDTCGSDLKQMCRDALRHIDEVLK